MNSLDETISGAAQGAERPREKAGGGGRGPDAETWRRLADRLDAAAFEAARANMLKAVELRLRLRTDGLGLPAKEREGMLGDVLEIERMSRFDWKG